MANTTSQVETWSSFYTNKNEEIPTLQACFDMSFENYDTMTHALNQLGDKLVLRMVTLPHNFILLPGSSTQGKILLLHHCFTVSEPGERPILVGVNGDRYSSSFKAFDPTTPQSASSHRLWSHPCQGSQHAEIPSIHKTKTSSQLSNSSWRLTTKITSWDSPETTPDKKYKPCSTGQHPSSFTQRSLLALQE